MNKFILSTDLHSKSKADLIVHINTIEPRIIELETLLDIPKKNSKNSSSRPSSDIKGNTTSSQHSHPGRVGHGKGGRRLHPSPDTIIHSKLKKCSDCGEAIPDGSYSLHMQYDHIELPKVDPIVTRIMQYKSYCIRCHKSSISPAPEGYKIGSPFGKSVDILASYLRYCHHIGYERLSGLFSEMFSLKISEGALSNLFQRLKKSLEPRVEEILTRIRSSRIICSDETGARVNGKNQWQWVFQNDDVCLHVIKPSRGKDVVNEVMAGHRPCYWVSDLYSSQRGHADNWQICIAHQLRDCEYIIECGDHEFGTYLRWVLLRAIVVAKRRTTVKTSTMKGYRYDLDRRLDRCLSLMPQTERGKKLKRRMLRERAGLFTFCEDVEIEPTNNSSERALRPSVIFRKVTNGFRSDWGKDFYSAIRSVIDTGKRQGLSSYESITKGLSDEVFFIPQDTSKPIVLSSN